MTREEAIVLFEKQLTAAQVVLDSGFGSNPGENDSLYRRRKEMAEIALSALRPVSREQVEKAWMGCKYCDEEWGTCNPITNRFTMPPRGGIRFCPMCGRPLTDEAVEMVMERLEVLHDTEN